MKVDWRKLSHIGAAIVGVVVPGVVEAESAAWAIGGMHGKAKQDKVVDLVRAALLTANTVTERALATDADVEQATRSVIDAVVGLQKIVATKAAAAS